MGERVFDSEIKLLELIWSKEPVSAKELSVLAGERIGWNKNTTYTVLNKMVAKGYVRRGDPGFVCTSLISKDEIRRTETKGLVDKLFGGSKKALFSALLQDEELSGEDIEELRRMIEKR